MLPLHLQFLHTAMAAMLIKLHDGQKSDLLKRSQVLDLIIGGLNRHQCRQLDLATRAQAK
jgi:hypothetical protein